MLDDLFVIDAVVHPYNLSAGNRQSHFYAEAARGLLWGLHTTWNPPEHRLPIELYLTDWPPEMLARTLFLESDVDVAVNHRLPIHSVFKDGLVSHEKNVELATRWPQRFVTYLGVDPMQGVDVAIRDLERQRRDLPDAVGLKLYPDQVEPLRSWRMDDRDVAFPIYAAAKDLGIRNIAIHKALINGPVRPEPYRVDDVFDAAAQHPDLTFEIVHGGMAFTDETAQAIAIFPNVYVNLEVTSMYLVAAPGVFEEILAKFVYWGGPEKIIFSSGGIFSHPQPLIERLAALEFGPETLHRHGLEPLTRADKALMLGGNYARIAGLDLEARRRAIAGDEFSRERAARGRRPIYEVWKEWGATKGLVC